VPLIGLLAFGAEVARPNVAGLVMLPKARIGSVVQEVEKFGTKLHTYAFAKSPSLTDREIPLIKAAPKSAFFPMVPKVPCARVYYHNVFFGRRCCCSCSPASTYLSLR
jgi:hypothetical protein